MDKDEKKSKKNELKRIIVKGYLRPDGTYYVSIPKEVREVLELKGGEYFIIKAKPEKKKISLKLVEFLDEQTE
jgi:AbrB family looped-hinge helix DNA binding protein